MGFLTQRQADLALLTRWQTKRDAHAFHELTGRYSGLVFNTCRRVLRNESEAEDVTQECFLKLATSEIAIESSLGAWLHRLATHRAIDHLRSESKRRLREHAYAGEQSQVSVPEWDELQGQIDAAIDALPEDQRRVLVAHFLEGKTQKGIAKDLGVSRRVVAYRIQKAIDQVRARLRRQGAGAELKHLDGMLVSGALACLGKAVPANLSGSLAKLSISGLPPIRDGAIAATSIHQLFTLAFGVLAMKKVLAVVVALIVLAAGWYLSKGGSVEESHTIAQTDMGASTEKPAADEQKAAMSASPGMETAGAPASSRATRESVPEEAPATPAKASPYIHETDQVATVSGLVLDLEDAPIAGATVRVIATGLEANPGETASRSDYRRAAIEVLRSAEHAFMAKTDAHGVFRVEGIRYMGMAIGSAEAEGFALESQVLLLNPNDDQEVTFRLSEGFPLEGRVLSALGAPVTDGTVSVSALVTGTSVSAGPAGLNSSATTDEKGEFCLWLKPWGDGEAQASFEVSSMTHGKTSIRDITILPGTPITLKYQPTSSMHGTLSLPEGAPAKGYTVRLTGQIVVRKPNGGTTTSMGFEYSAQAAANGEYRIEGIDSAQVYTADVLMPSGEMVAAGRDPGAFVAGEDKQWDYAIEKHATLKGKVYGTETRLPLPGRIVRCTRIDAPVSTSAAELHTMTGADGAYSLQVHSGQGLYRVHADYGMDANGADFGGVEQNYTKQVALAPGKEETVDLELPEPWKCRFVITDGVGAPIEGATAYVQESLSTGSTISNVYPAKSDRSGRIEIAGLTPGSTAAFRFERAGFLKASLHLTSGEMSGMEPITLSGSAGQEFPEQNVVLYRATSVEAALVDSAGQALAKTPLVVNVYEGDALIASAKTTTDANGVISIQGGVPAVTGSIEILTGKDGADAGSGLGYTSPEMALPADEIIDLGTLTLD